MNLLPLVYPTFARELVAARAALTVGREVGLALRAHRRELGVSQRAYARLRELAPGQVARLETHADDLKLADVVAALAPTRYCLALCRRPEPDGDDSRPGVGGAALPVPVAPTHWPRAELLAVVRGGSRRFPAHRHTEQVDYPPNWWWYSESTRARAVRPHWSAAGRDLPGPGPEGSPSGVEREGAA
ncbi:hypothetical protein [Phycicoccus sp.]|uniref:hypothetical protein n=1 Tax=Phycicoccus sp. TaxID=1902410 RepID=UPI002D09A33C|nr:hypothetical protein [Phycicoccus sp.]HMM97206.1 hypothetical protein [Phycicoccus sp.]